MLATALIALVAAHGSVSEQVPLGDTVRISVRPCEPRRWLSALELRVFSEIGRHLEAELGLPVEVSVPDDLDEQLRRVAEARADVFVMSPFTYVLAHERYGAEARFCLQKLGSSEYRSAIVVRADGGVRTLEDLRGRRVLLDQARGNPLRYWLGYDLLAHARLLPVGGVEDEEELPLELVSAPGIDPSRAILGVYKGTLDAAAIYYLEPGPEGRVNDARSRLLPAVADVAERVVVLATSEGVPFPTVAFRALPEDDARRLFEALGAALGDDGTRRILQQVAAPLAVDDLVPIDDARFDRLRAVMARHCIDPAEQLPRDDDTY